MKIEKIFTANQFTPTQWETAKDKADFANYFAAFVKSGFPQSGFTKKFYTRLSRTFGHIAYYNQGGFWDRFFTSISGKVNFIEKSVNYHCYGFSNFTYSDVERALQLWLVENNVLTNMYESERAGEKLPVAKIE
jgi:hypothetical protein